MKYLIYFIFLISTAFGYSQNWNTNFEEAKAKAEKENKNILLVFSGSDWCGPCIKLEKVVWKSPEFQVEADKNWVIYRADFPNKRKNQLAPDMVETNNKLAEKYNKNGIFPLVMLLDPKGKVIGMTGFKNVSAQDYIKLIHSFK
ncbi:thioredoxin family protein [Flavobacterium aquariorum]|uniref:Thioredoxin family protein n=1 Tax=Flavobacterium aquariorum TaxID=2217670 RepID=A0A2W7TT89_9FLAO|nr:thioredoxin family protein [Flavobacterium aquariorum]PZX93471.1 thioredoxin family protein [Flavobacterium aquariorum]